MGPTFIGIGAPRCGTTWLHRVLSHHPQIHMSTPKQLDLFDKNILKHDLPWYLSHFDPAPDEPARPVRGEISPRYSLLPASLVEMARRHFPEARIVLLIRQPVDRIWSNVLQEFGFRRGRNVNRTPIWRLQQYCQSPRSTRATDYEAIIDRWSGVFGKDQVHVELFDDVKSDPRNVIQRILAHLGADPIWSPPEELLHQQVHAGAVIAGQKASMPEMLRAELSRHWLAPTRKLNERFGGRLNHWVEQLERDAANLTSGAAVAWTARSVVFSAPERIACTVAQSRRWKRARRRWDSIPASTNAASLSADPAPRTLPTGQPAHANH